MPSMLIAAGVLFWGEFMDLAIAKIIQVQFLFSLLISLHCLAMSEAPSKAALSAGRSGSDVPLPLANVGVAVPLPSMPLFFIFKVRGKG